MMGTFLRDIRNRNTARQAARQYVMAADRFREMARDERRAGRDGRELDRIAANLIRNASWEVTA